MRCKWRGSKRWLTMMLEDEGEDELLVALLILAFDQVQEVEDALFGAVEEDKVEVEVDVARVVHVGVALVLVDDVVEVEGGLRDGVEEEVVVVVVVAVGVRLEGHMAIVEEEEVG